MNRIRKVGLLTFLKGSSNINDKMPGCSNYDHDHGGCLFEDHGADCPCAVEKGKPCTYFERTVLPTANDIGQGVSITAEYERQTKSLAVRFRTATRAERRCPDCADPLGPRQRYCERCSKKRKRAAARNRTRQFRKSKREQDGTGVNP